MSMHTWVVALAMLLPVGAWGQEPPHRERGPELDEQQFAQGDGRRGPGPRRGIGRMDEVSADLWRETVEFMEQHSPNRYAFYLELPEEHPARGFLRTHLADQFHNLVQIREDDYDLYEIKVQQIAQEDLIFGLLRQIRVRAGELEEDEREQLRGYVTDLVELHFREREYRIHRLESALHEEREELKKQQERKEAEIERQMSRWQRRWGPREPRMMRDGPPRQWGEGPPRGEGFRDGPRGEGFRDGPRGEGFRDGPRGDGPRDRRPREPE